MDEIFKDLEWNAPHNATVIKVIDMHTGGEPLRIPISGLPQIEGDSVLAKRRFFCDHLDYIRRGLIFEPRGHADMYGAILSSPSTLDADFDVFFIHNEGYSTMCGHAIIALVKFVFETGLIPFRETGKLTINVPAGKIRATAEFSQGQVVKASFENVPSFVLVKNETIQIDGVGQIIFDIAYGGAFYAIVNADLYGISLARQNAAELIDLGKRIKKAIIQSYKIEHPVEPDLSFLYGTILVGKAHVEGRHSRNVCVFADGELDRSATGSGVSARAALHFINREIGLQESITIESIIGTTLTVCVSKTENYEGYEAVIPIVSGTAHFTGSHEFCFDPNDPLINGFLVR